MATNVAQVIEAATMAAQPTVSALNWNLIVMAIIGLVTSTISAVMAYFMARLNKSTEKHAENSAATKEIATETAKVTKEIKNGINGERTELLNKVDALRNEILAISMAHATLKETHRQSEEAALLSKAQIAQIVAALLERRQELNGNQEKK